tara:strand:- start:231 stop:395 length:165 start_codon:yes stop_codon:yes gene_type:complete
MFPSSPDEEISLLIFFLIIKLPLLSKRTLWGEQDITQKRNAKKRNLLFLIEYIL